MSAAIEWDPPLEVREHPGRIADRHISFLFEAEQVGSHVHVKVRAASRVLSVQVNHSRGLCGELTMTPEEWLLLRKALESAETPGPAWIKDGGRGCIIIGAGHPALEACEPPEIETDHEAHRFIEIIEGGSL